VNGTYRVVWKFLILNSFMKEYYIENSCSDFVSWSAEFDPTRRRYLWKNITSRTPVLILYLDQRSLIRLGEGIWDPFPLCKDNIALTTLQNRCLSLQIFQHRNLEANMIREIRTPYDTLYKNSYISELRLRFHSLLDNFRSTIFPPQ
jgi:hypothetical protein